MWKGVHLDDEIMQVNPSQLFGLQDDGTWKILYRDIFFKYFYISNIFHCGGC